MSFMVLLTAFPLALFVRFVKMRRPVAEILIIGVETSANIQQMALALSRHQKYRVTVAPFNEHPFYSWLQTAPYNLVSEFIETPVEKFHGKLIIRLNKARYVFYSLLKYDIVIFNWTSSLLNFNLDYLLFKIARIKLIVRHCGDDVRYRPLQNGIHSHFGVTQWKSEPSNLFVMLSRIYRQRWAEATATVLSSKDQATFQGRALVERPHVQQALTRTVGHCGASPVVLHVPSDPTIKGTETFRRATEALLRDGIKFTPIELTNVRHEIVLTHLQQTAILVDQPSAVPGRLAIEGMATGCAIIGGSVGSLCRTPPPPILQFVDDPAHLYQLLRQLIQDSRMTESLGQASLEYWQLHYSQESFDSFFAQVLASTHIQFNRLANHSELLREQSHTWYERLATRLLFRKIQDVD